MYNSMTTQSAEEDQVLRSKAPEQLLNGHCGEIVFSKWNVAAEIC